MHINRDAHGELVSNPSAREMQGSSAHTAAPDLDAGNLSWSEPHAGKRDIGDLNNRTLIDLTAAGIPIPAHLAILTFVLLLYVEKNMHIPRCVICKALGPT